MLSGFKCPPEFEDKVETLKKAHNWTERMVKSLQRFVRRPYNVNKDFGETTNKTLPVRELELLGRACDQYKNHFPNHELATLMEKTSTVCSMLGKREVMMQLQMSDRAVAPLRIWVDEDYPRLLKELHKLTILHSKMVKAQKTCISKPTDINKKKSEEATTIYNRQHLLCATEMAGIEKVFDHHSTCLKLLIQMQFYHAKYAVEEIAKARSAAVVSTSRVAVISSTKTK